MEIVLIIVGIVVALWLFGAYTLNKKFQRYSRAIHIVINFMDSSNYKKTPIYKARMEALEQQGWTTTCFNLIQEMRFGMIRDLDVSASFFSRPDVLNLEHLFIMKYAVAHGYAEEFQQDMVEGKALEDLMMNYKQSQNL